MFLPASLPILRAWVLARGIGPPPLTGYAVTPGLRQEYGDADLEELEFAATARAARASLRLVPGTEPRRVVVALEVAGAVVRDDLATGAVEIGVPVPWRCVSCALVDDEDAQAAVARAISAVDAADLGELAAVRLVEQTEGYDLQWFATQELTDL